MTIRTRLTISFTLLVGTILMGFSLTIYFFYAQYRQDEFFDRLQKKAYTTSQLLTDANGISPELLRAMDQNELTVLFAEEITIYDSAGRMIFESGQHPYPITPSVLSDVRQGKILRLQQGEKEIAIIPFRQGQETLIVAIYAIDRYGFNKLERLRTILFTGWVISIVVTLLAGRYFAGKALRPVSYIVNQVRGISASNIHARLKEGKEKDELSELAQTFNAMLERLEEGFYLQKSFVSHASHELRTPLSIMMSQIEVARMQKRTTDHYEGVMDSVLEEIRKMNKLSTGLLDLTRASADSTTVSFDLIRLDDILWQSRTDLLKKLPGAIVDIEFIESPEQEEDLIVQGNSMLLATAVLNIMENGCKYSPDSHVQVSLHSLPDSLRLYFKDKGIGISPEDQPYIFEPFYRAEKAGKVSGHGIGLALAQKIIHLHKGEIHLKSQLGVGTTFFVQLPLFYSSASSE